MKKMLVLLLIALCSASLFAQMAKYDRKSISITKMNVSAGAKTFAKTEDVNYIYGEVYKKLKGMERFDYNEIPAGITDVNELMKITKEYAATKIEERAAKQWNIKNEYYGSNFITGENVDKILNGAFIIVPTLGSFAVVEGKDDKGKATFAITLNVKLEVYEGVKTGNNYEAKLASTINASGTNVGLGSLLALGNLSLTEKDPRVEAREQAVNAMLLLLDKEVRKLPVFTIKAFTTKVDPTNDKIHFNLGQNVGIKLDEAYTVGYYQGDKFVETGFMKVRRIEKEGSESQLIIVTNPKGDKETELFNEFDQVIEYPQVGLNFIIGGGMSGFKGWDDLDIKSISDVEYENGFPYPKLEDKNLCGAINISAEYNVAKFINVSELYASVGFEYLMAEIGKVDGTSVGGNKIEYEPTVFVYEAGFTKKFYKRKLGFYFGADFNYMTSTTKIKYNSVEQSDEIKLSAIGGKVKVGINYLLGKNAFLDLGVGYRFFGEAYLTDDIGVLSSGDIFFEKTDNGHYKDNGYWTPAGLVLKAGIGFTL